LATLDGSPTVGLEAISDLVVDGAVKDLRCPPAGQIEQLLAAEHETRALQKHGQQAELGRGESDLGPIVADQPALVRIERPAVEDQPTSRKAAARHFGPLAPAQDRLDPGQKLTRVEGLGQIVVRADLQTDDPVGFVPQGGQHQDRDGAACAQPPADRQPVLAGHHHIEHDKIEGSDLQRCVHCPGVGGHGHAHAVLLQVFRQGVPDFAVVINDEDMRRRGHCCLLTRRLADSGVRQPEICSQTVANPCVATH
jgi:hypothetical protein